MMEHPLIGRERERAELGLLLADARRGRGNLVLVAGDAGVGKTRLVGDALAGSGARVLAASGVQGGTPPFGPLVSVLRAYLRRTPDGFARCGPFFNHLALLLPELGARPPQHDDRETQGVTGYRYGV